MSSATLADLVVRTRAGDRDAWGALTGRYVGMVQAICDCYRLTGDDAAEVSQVAWLRLAESLAHVRRPDALGGWLAAVTRSQCLRRLRTTGRLVVSAVTDPHTETPADRDAGGLVSNDGVLDPRLARSERDRALLAALATLEIRCQRLARLLVVEPRLTPDEIGPALDIPVPQVAAARRRCLDGLAAALADPPPGDDALLAALRGVVAVTSPAPAAGDPTTAPCAAWLASDAQFAELAYDSVVAAGRPSGSRAGAAGPRAVSYSAGPRSVRLALAVSANQVVVEGEVRPPGRVRVVVVTPGGQVATDAGDDGRFRFDELPRRPLSVVVAGSKPLKTGWILP